jgi:hypothetical protein
VLAREAPRRRCCFGAAGRPELGGRVRQRFNGSKAAAAAPFQGGRRAQVLPASLILTAACEAEPHRMLFKTAIKSSPPCRKAGAGRQLN